MDTRLSAKVRIAFVCVVLSLCTNQDLAALESDEGLWVVELLSVSFSPSTALF